MKIKYLFPAFVLVAGMTALSARAVLLSDEVIYGGAIFQVPEGGTTAEDWVFIGATGNPSFRVQLEFMEPGTLNQVSDILVTDQNGSIWFVSDDENGNFPVAPFPFALSNPTATIVETGGLQDVSDFFHLPQGFLLVQSDVEAVPEPATVLAGALLLLPIGVSAFRILRNRKPVSA